MSKGSILMEYVVIVSAIAFTVLAFMDVSFFNLGSGFGPVGQKIVAFYQRLQGGIALPIP